MSSWAMGKDTKPGLLLSIVAVRLALPGPSIYPSAVVVLCCHPRRPCPFVHSLVQST